jgi:hypothetical protein
VKFLVADHFSFLSNACLKSYIIGQLELKLGLGGTSYEDFIRNLHLPPQLR